MTIEEILKAAKALQDYCRSIPSNCGGCIFNKHDPDGYFFKGCLLNDPDHLPETWELEKTNQKARNKYGGYRISN